MAKQMSRVVKFLKYKASEKGLDSFTETKLQQWLAARADLLNPEMQRLFKRMYQFALRTQFEGFDPVFKKLVGGSAESATTTPASIELIAGALCRGINARESDIARKSLQEAFYFCTGIAPELSPLLFGKRLQAVLRLRGIKGIIRVFLRMHLCNLICTDLHDSLQADTPTGDVLNRRLEEIERICQNAAAAGVSSWTKWSEPDLNLTATLILDLKTEMTQMLGNNRLSLRGA